MPTNPPAQPTTAAGTIGTPTMNIETWHAALLRRRAEDRAARFAELEKLVERTLHPVTPNLLALFR